MPEACFVIASSFPACHTGSLTEIPFPRRDDSSMKYFLVTLATMLPASLGTAAGEPPLLLQKPTVNRTHIVFTFAGDLWSVSRNGGAATRLTSGPGVETEPPFPPAATQIAFTGEYAGYPDVYLMPAP